MNYTKSKIVTERQQIKQIINKYNSFQQIITITFSLQTHSLNKIPITI